MLSKKIKKAGPKAARSRSSSKPGKEHRFVVVFRGEGLAGPLTSTDPNREGLPLATAQARERQIGGAEEDGQARRGFLQAGPAAPREASEGERLPDARHRPPARTSRSSRSATSSSRPAWRSIRCTRDSPSWSA